MLTTKPTTKTVPVCSQLNEEQRWEWVQRSCNNNLQNTVEKSGVRKSDASPRWLMREVVGMES